MSFFLRPDGWAVSFVEADCKTPVGQIRTIRTDEVLRLTVERGGGLTDLEARHMLALAIEKGRGAVWLSLDASQYASLLRGSKKPPQRERDPGPE